MCETTSVLSMYASLLRVSMYALVSMGFLHSELSRYSNYQCMVNVSRLHILMRSPVFPSVLDGVSPVHVSFRAHTVQ